jgi:hypothetical protein
LEKDIQELLHAWSNHLAAAQLIFVSAPSSNSKAVFGTAADKETSPLSSSDLRVRRVPFMTQRPTFSEVKRVVRVLASVFEIPREVIERQRLQALEAQEMAAADAGEVMADIDAVKMWLLKVDMLIACLEDYQKS